MKKFLIWSISKEMNDFFLNICRGIFGNNIILKSFFLCTRSIKEEMDNAFLKLLGINFQFGPLHSEWMIILL